MARMPEKTIERSSLCKWIHLNDMVRYKVMASLRLKTPAQARHQPTMLIVFIISSITTTYSQHQLQ